MSAATTQSLTVAVRPRAAARRTVAARASAKPVAAPLAHRVAKLAQGAAAGAALLTASPAFALVDDRLNGDGAGIAFGVNDPVLGAHLLGVFTTIWALYYISTQSEVFVKRGGKNDDSGLSL